MGLTDVLPLVVRWLHALAAAAWVGGGLFYLFVLRPARQKSGAADSSPFIRAASAEFGGLVDLCVITLVVTGTILAVTRLTAQSLGVPYFVTLGVKIALALWMFAAVQSRRRRRTTGEVSEPPTASRLGRLLAPFRGTNATVTLGVVVFLLADILQFLVERSLRGS